MTPAREPGGRLGRPRDAAIDAAVLDATVTVLMSVGYPSLTLEEVARRAGTTKPTVRRRWPGRAHLVLAALGARLGPIEAPDTGCTLCDLGECLELFTRSFACIPPDMLGPLLADCSADPELRNAFMTTLFQPPRAAVEQTLTRAFERGDLRERVDPAVVLDLIGSFVYYRVLFGHGRVGRPEIDQAVEALLRGVAGDYEGLVAHGRGRGSPSGDHPRHA